MGSHPFDTDFLITPEHKAQFGRNGFVKLEGFYNAEVVETLLARVEDDFEPGDALLFNKMVVHRSIMLGEGALPRCAAYVMRFIDAGPHHDLQRAKNLEYPAEKYGKGFFPYKPFTRFHIEIAEAGAQDGDVLAEYPCFDDRDRRTIRRERDFRPEPKERVE